MTGAMTGAMTRRGARPAAARRARERGLTIVELMIAMTLVTLLIGIAFQIGIIVVNGYRQHREAVAVQRAARGSLDLVADAVRNASAAVSTADITDAVGCSPFKGIDVVDGGEAPDELWVMTAAGGLVTSLRDTIDATSAVATVLDAEGLSPGDVILVTDFDRGHLLQVTSVTESGGAYQLGIEPTSCAGVTFAYNPGALVLRARAVRFYVEDVDGVPTLMMDPDGDGALPAEPLAEGVEDLQVAVGVDVNGDGVTSDLDGEWFYGPGADPSDAPPSILVRPWRALRLTIVARSVREDAAGDVSARPAIENRSGGAVDGFRRRMVSTIVEIRNLEGSP